MKKLFTFYILGFFFVGMQSLCAFDIGPTPHHNLHNDTRYDEADHSAVVLKEEEEEFNK